MMSDPQRSDLPEWKSLEKHSAALKNTRLRDLFDEDDNRFDSFHIQTGELLFDFSKQLITTETVQKLCDYASACNLENWRDKMFEGAPINVTENRAVLHTALRAKTNASIQSDGKDIYPEIQNSLEKMKVFSEKVRGEKRFTDVVNIGIGGSDLGSVMAYEALKSFTDRDINLHFVSNVDATHLAETLRVINSEKTLFIIVSKTFTTQETITNATSARDWLREKLGTQDVSNRFVAVSQNVSGVEEFGITANNVFPIWDWVGGRYSIWSAVGLPLCIALGFEQFKQMLDGAASMDEHFKTAPLDQNIPVMLGLIGMWNRNFLNHESLAVIPYDQYLHRFPAYLQQLDMESNGKSIDRTNRKVPYQTGPVIFGDAGTNSQHAFFQLIHQGTTVIPCEFIASTKNQNPIGDHQKKLLANVLAQSKALMEGQNNDDPHKIFEGNRPSSTLLFDELTPYTLGILIALYEHKIFVQGILWNINSFDQCGVELGKILAKDIIGAFDENSKNTDSSTKNLINTIKKTS